MADKIKNKWSQETLETVGKLCLFYDDFMSMVLDENIEATEFILKTIFGRSDMKVPEVKGQ